MLTGCTGLYLPVVAGRNSSTQGLTRRLWPSEQVGEPHVVLIGQPHGLWAAQEEGLGASVVATGCTKMEALLQASATAQQAAVHCAMQLATLALLVDPQQAL